MTKSFQTLVFKQQPLAPRITTDRWYPSFFLSGFLDAVLVYSQLTIYALFASIISLALVSEREREGENIFPSINQSICCLKLLFPEQTNSFVCDKYFFFTKFDYFQYFFPIFFFNPGDLPYYSCIAMDIPSVVLTTIRECKNSSSDLKCVFSSVSGR